MVSAALLILRTEVQVCAALRDEALRTGCNAAFGALAVRRKLVFSGIAFFEKKNPQSSRVVLLHNE